MEPLGKPLTVPTARCCGCASSGSSATRWRSTSRASSWCRGSPSCMAAAAAIGKIAGYEWDAGIAPQRIHTRVGTSPLHWKLIRPAAVVAVTNASTNWPAVCSHVRRAIRLEHVLYGVEDVVFGLAVHLVRILGDRGNTGTVRTKFGQLTFTTNRPGASRIRLSGRGAVAINRSRMSAKPVRLPGGFG
jgi:hypothetical protein